jgi:hypothetical protein
MTNLPDNLNTPWTLDFERDGTEDVAVIYDADYEELVRSRPFWLPQRDDPVPPTLAAMRLMRVAPSVLAALAGVIDYAENEAYCLENLKDSPEAEAEAAKAWQAVEAGRAVLAEAATGGPPSESGEADLHAMLAGRRQIADLWSVEDVRQVRPGLSDSQAWDVLRAARRHYDPATGITWDVLRRHADALHLGMQPYSVLLLYPDYVNDSGTETYYALVEAADPLAAVAEARRQAVAAQEGIEIDPDDFVPLLVTAGHHHSEPLFDK